MGLARAPQAARVSSPAPDTGLLAPPPAGGHRHLVWLFAPSALRDPLAALFAIEREIESSLRPGVDHAVAHARLEWWSDESGRLARGTPAHPLSRALLDGALAAKASPPDLRGLVESARLDLAAVAYETRDELEETLRAWALATFRVVVALGAGGLTGSGVAERFAQWAGPPLREIERLATLARDAWSGRICMPLGRGEDGPARWRAQPWPAECEVLLAERLAEARKALAGAAATLDPEQRPAQRAALVWCALSTRLGARSVACLPFQYSASRLDPLSDTLCAWRAALAANRGRLPPALRSTE